jgi:hypothetical protein
MDLFETHILGVPLSELRNGLRKLDNAKAAMRIEIDEQTSKLLNPLLSDDMLRDIESKIIRMLNRVDDYSMAIRMAERYIDDTLGRGHLIGADS